MNRDARLYLSTALLTLAVVVVTVNAGLAIRSLQVLDNSQYWVAHTWEVIDSVDQILGSLKDAESGSRGFLITGNNEYLHPYLQARKDIPGELDNLQHLTIDNPRQQERITELRAVIELRLDLLQHGIDERSAGGLDDVRPLVISGTGQFEMDRIRGIAGAMKQEEQALLKTRSSTTISAEHRASATTILASTVDLLLIVFVSWSLVREQKLRRISEAAKNRLQMLQSISDVALTQLPIAELSAELLKRLRTVVGADATLLAVRRAGDLVIDAAEGISIHPGTRVGPAPQPADSTSPQATPSGSPADPLHRAVEENRITIVNYQHGGVYVPATAPGDHIPATLSFSESAEPSGTETLPGINLRTLLIIPLSISGRAIGVLVAARHQANAFLFQDEELLSVVADRISIALDRANAYEAERDARHIAEQNADQVRALNAELELRVAQRTSELQATNTELEAFSYSVSHDLRAPLRTVDGFSLALEEDYSAVLDKAGIDFVRRIRDGVQRMGQLIDALLQLSRITRADITREPVDISHLAKDLAADLQQQNPERRITFKIQPGLHAEGDPKLLRVGLENLLGNAVKFTGKREEALIELGQSPETGEFFIRDNGAGFDMRYAGKLFNAFQRLHGEKDFKGSGIGLATVARVIRRHHGTMRAEGQVDQGATFWFTLG